MLGHLCHCRHVSQLFRDALSRGNNTFARDVPKGLTLPGFPATLGPLENTAIGSAVGPVTLGFRQAVLEVVSSLKYFLWFSALSRRLGLRPRAQRPGLRRAGRTGLAAMPAERQTFERALR